MILRTLLVTASIISLCSCQKEAVDPLQAALYSDNPAIKKVMDNLEAHEVQIALSVVDYSKDVLAFKDYNFQVNDSVYFYPASTIKLPMVLITLEQLYDNGFINLDATITVNGDSISSSFRDDIRDIFAVSSNAASNRLYEYLGNDFVNDRMHAVGLKNFRLAHRLSTPNSNAPKTKGLIFQGSEVDQRFDGEGYEMRPVQALDLKKINKGIGYYKKDSLIKEPMSFAFKNYYPISSLQGTMKRVIFPEYFYSQEQFKHSVELRQFLLESMQLLPRQAGYAQAEYYDSYVKFFMFGDRKTAIPKDISILNKVGCAYGYLTDCAYIIDRTNEIAFILSATLYVNENNIINDDHYQYEETGIPFLAALGRTIHQQLVQQK